MAREACPGPEFLSIRRNGVPAFASQRARTSPVGPAPTIRTCGWLTTFAPRFTGRYRSAIVGEPACGVKADRTAQWIARRSSEPLPDGHVSRGRCAGEPGGAFQVGVEGEVRLPLTSSST